MKIKLIKVYQPITFESANQMSFTTTEYHQSNIEFSKRPKVEATETDNGVLLVSDKDAVLVGWANVAYIQYDRATLRDEVVKKASKEVMKQHSATLKKLAES